MKTCQYSIRTIAVLLPVALIINSCLRDFDLNMPDAETHVAVYCLFSPDSTWQARVYFTHHIDSTGNNSGITDATVTVEGQSGQVVLLDHKGMGWYRSDEKPAEGMHYRIVVDVEGYKTITAESYVPLRSDISNVRSYSRNNLCFEINPASEGEYYASIRGRFFDVETGYNIYCITEEVLVKLREQSSLPSGIVEKLKVLEGQTLYSYNVVEKVQALLTAEENFNYWYRIQMVFNEYAVCGKLNYKPSSLIRSGGCTSEQGIFYHAPNDHSILLMNECGKQEVILTVGSFGTSGARYESWIEFTDLSSDYYYFLRDLSLQLSNREEINAPPVIIYSNIHNGAGIFAGYQLQMPEHGKQ